MFLNRNVWSGVGAGLGRHGPLGLSTSWGASRGPHHGSLKTSVAAVGAACSRGRDVGTGGQGGASGPEPHRAGGSLLGPKAKPEDVACGSAHVLRTWRVVLPMCCASVDTLRLHSQADELLGGAEDDPLTVKQACWASLSASPVVWI